MTGNYNILKKKLTRFITKYYKNQMLKGVILFLALFLVFTMLSALIEYFGYFGQSTRTVLFFSYLLLNACILIYYVVFPMLRLLRIGKTISNEEASLIIGKHFPEVSDKLLNTLQLRILAKDNVSNEIINASIDQRTAGLIPVPFSNAISFKTNLKYVRYAIIPLLIAIIILLISPALLTEPSYRIIHYNKHFEKALPYEIRITNEKLEAIQQENFTLNVNVHGDEIPTDIYIEFQNARYRLSRSDLNNFSYEFINLQNDIEFHLSTIDYLSEKHALKVLPKPIILNFELSLDYPDYTKKQDKTFKNNGDLSIPEGTKARWNFYTRDASGIIIRFPDMTDTLGSAGSNVLEHSRSLFKPQNYSISVFNEHFINPDSLSYFINTVPDLYPSIYIEKFNDTVFTKNLYFRGLIKDDYGFNKLNFVYAFVGKEEAVYNPISIDNNNLQYQFFHQFDLSLLDLKPGQEIEYYFEVWDNDGINGSKMTRSDVMYYKVPSLEEIEEATEEADKMIRKNLEQSISEAMKLQMQINRMQEKLVNEETLTWEDRQQIQDLLNQHKSLQEKIDKVKEENLEKNQREKQFREMNEELLEKQKQLEELMDEVLTDDIIELIEDIQEMLDQVDKDKVNQMLEKMEKNAEQLSEDLDRSLEWFKQLEFDKKLTETIEKLNELAKEQEELAKKSDSRAEKSDSLLSRQDELNKKFEQLRKDLDDLHEKNQALEEPNPLINTDKSEEAIQEDMQNSMNSLDKNQRKKASQSQRNASQQMQELSDFLFSMQQMMTQESLGEDIAALRQILDNLVQLSFDQEEIMNRVSSIDKNDPGYPELIQNQNRLKDDLEIVKDSLYALSKRQMSIQPFVTREIDDINKNVGEAISFLNERRKPQATSRQQYVMTSINNLALLLSEAMQQMQQNMSMSTSSCKNSGKPKPGKGKPSPKSMSELQQQLNQSLQQLKQGKNQNQSQGKQSMSEQLARMAAQQEALRRQLQQYMEQLKSETGSGDAGLKKIMEEMERTEMELVNKIITDETMKRQKDIVTRLLQHDKAEREREKEERRESTEAKNAKISNPDTLFEYNQMKLKEAELLKTIPPKLRPYYKLKVTQYFYKFMD